MDWFLIIVAIVGFFLTFAIALYLVAYYGSEEDKNQAWFPKVVVVVGLSLSGFTVLLLPFDVANAKDPSTMEEFGGLDVTLMWQLVLYTIVGWTIVVTPFATFWYEAYQPGKTFWSQIMPAIRGTAVFLFGFILLFVILYLLIGKTAIGVENHVAPGVDWDFLGGETRDLVPWVRTNCFCSDDPLFCQKNDFKSLGPDDKSICDYEKATLEFRVSAFIYAVGLLASVGWLGFIVFAGVGLIALPMDLINDWRMRPRRITRAEYEMEKKKLRGEIIELVEEGRQLEAKERNNDKGWFGSLSKKANRYKAKVLDIEKRNENLDESMNVGRIVLLSWIKLPLGILGILLSFLWIAHIIVYNVTHYHLFLNTYFKKLDNFFPLFGTISYAVAAIWMLWCAVKGCFKVGVNFGIIRIHPMKPMGTLMSSFLFNTMLILLSSVTVGQFCAMSFRDYAANTVVDSMFSGVVQNLIGMSVVLTYFQYVMLGFAGLTFLYLIVKPWCCRGNQQLS